MFDSSVLFDSWSALARVAVVAPLAYAGLIVALRASGKRTLSKLNAFDFVVTVALGSTFATVVLSKDVALAEGILAFAALIGLQYAVAWTSVRSARVRGLVKSEPRLLVRGGALLETAMREERITREEVMSALRQAELGGLEGASAVVLETDGTLSVIKAEAGQEALRDVRAPPAS